MGPGTEFLRPVECNHMKILIFCGFLLPVELYSMSYCDGGNLTLACGKADPPIELGTTFGAL